MYELWQRLIRHVPRLTGRTMWGTLSIFSRVEIAVANYLPLIPNDLRFLLVYSRTLLGPSTASEPSNMLPREQCRAPQIVLFVLRALTVSANNVAPSAFIVLRPQQ